MEDYSKIASESDSNNAVINHALCLESLQKVLFWALGSELLRPIRLVLDDRFLHEIVYHFYKKHREENTEPFKCHLDKISLRLVKQALQISDQAVLEAEVKAKGKPDTELPTEQQLVPRVHAEEYSRVAYRQAKSQS